MEDNIEVLDLLNEQDMKTLSSEIGQEGKFFKPVNDVTYKFELLDSKIIPIEKEFNGEIVKKYQISIKAKGSNGEDFAGIWEVGNSIIRVVMKGYSENIKKFTVSKKGTGIDTRYNINVDF